jgi:hypothetical protein
VSANTEPIAREDLTPYIGEWVALRAGYVVAHNSELGDLFADEAVLRSDVAIFCHRPGTIFLLPAFAGASDGETACEHLDGGTSEARYLVGATAMTA